MPSHVIGVLWVMKNLVLGAQGFIEDSRMSDKRVE